jgi:hypothetical protein
MTTIEVLKATRKGNWMQTYTGKAYWPCDPKTEEVDIHDIAHALSLICRYTGHCKKFYSVAEHSVHVSHLVPPEYAFYGLMHDAQEAYVNDIARPLKPSIAGYQEIEEMNWRVICDKYRMPYELPREVKEIDRRICMDEQAAIMGPSPFPWDKDLGLPTGIGICAWAPEKAEQMFIARFRETGAAHVKRVLRDVALEKIMAVRGV